MVVSIAAIVVGLVVLIWSARRFVVGSVAIAQYYRLHPLMIGMVIVGFGTSAPEITVSAIAAAQGSPGIALGNAFGSNIINIALILGTTALISPILVQSQILKRELPVLAIVTALVVFLLWDDEISRLNAAVLLLVFAALLLWTIREARRNQADILSQEMAEELAGQEMPIRRSLLWVIVGLLLLAGSSRLLVWGAVSVAESLGVSDLVIGLTIVAIGTSLPELASSIVAARKGHHDVALGNVIGSNLFNTVAVLGIAGVIAPLPAEESLLRRDIPVLAVLTVLLFVFGYRFRAVGRINRVEGGVLLASYVAYTIYLLI